MSDGAGRSRGMKARARGKTAGKIWHNEWLLADLCGVVGIIIHQREAVKRLKQCDASGVVCIYRCMYRAILSFSVLTPFLPPPKQTDF